MLHGCSPFVSWNPTVTSPFHPITLVDESNLGNYAHLFMVSQGNCSYVSVFNERLTNLVQWFWGHYCISIDEVNVRGLVSSNIVKRVGNKRLSLGWGLGSFETYGLDLQVLCSQSVINVQYLSRGTFPQCVVHRNRCMFLIT